jgi:hypothetical protein
MLLNSKFCTRNRVSFLRSFFYTTYYSTVYTSGESQVQKYSPPAMFTLICINIKIIICGCIIIPLLWIFFLFYLYLVDMCKVVVIFVFEKIHLSQAQQYIYIRKSTLLFNPDRSCATGCGSGDFTIKILCL